MSLCGGLSTSSPPEISLRSGLSWRLWPSSACYSYCSDRSSHEPRQQRRRYQLLEERCISTQRSSPRCRSTTCRAGDLWLRNERESGGRSRDRGCEMSFRSHEELAGYIHLVHLLLLILLLPQAGEAHRGAQLPGFGLLLTGNLKAFLKHSSASNS